MNTFKYEYCEDCTAVYECSGDICEYEDNEDSEIENNEQL